MDAPPVYVISDLHLGSSYCHHQRFLAWLDALPVGAGLILNGDIVDDPDKLLPPQHQAVVERLVAESGRRPLVWVVGNHDEGFELKDRGRIQFVQRWEWERRLLVVHGDTLDGVMPRHRLFKMVFKALHRLRIRMGFPNVHVAEYAKRWGPLYRVLNRHVARKALRAARAEGFAAVACGHTHAAMDLSEDGVRYLNTGAWTEKPLHYLALANDRIDLRVYDAGEG